MYSWQFSDATNSAHQVFTIRYTTSEFDNLAPLLTLICGLLHLLVLFCALPISYIKGLNGHPRLSADIIHLSQQGTRYFVLRSSHLNAQGMLLGLAKRPDGALKIAQSHQNYQC